MHTSSLTAAHSTATARTLRVWFLSNAGGTAWLMLDFGRDSPSDIGIPLFIGLMAAIISLASTPFIIPVFALAQRAHTGWRSRLVALAGVALAFALGNSLLLHLLPTGPTGDLFSISQPYLVAAALAVLWLYRPRTLFRRASDAPELGRFGPQQSRLAWAKLGH